MADLAAIGAANDLQNAQAAAAGTASANGWASPVRASVVLGSYAPDPTIAAGQRFTPGGANPTAAQVTLTAQANLFFGEPIIGRPTITITRTATASSAQMASFSLGSGLLAVQGGIANSLLSALTGSQVSLSAANYNALLNADVDLLQYSQAMQTKLNMTGVSFSQVMSTQVSTGQALSVLASELNSENQSAAAQAMTQIATAAGPGSTIQLQQLFNLGPYSGQDHTDAATGAGVTVNALDLASAMLQLAQGGRQVQLSLGSSVPGLTNLNVWLAIGQRPSNSPWLTVAQDGSVIISTAQARIYVDAQVAPIGSALTGAGVSLVNIPVFVQAASAEARLTGLSCPSSATAPAVVLAVQPSIGELALGQVITSTLNDFTQPVVVSPAQLVNLAALQITGQAQINIGGLDWQSVSFSQNDIASQAVKSVSTNDIARATVTSLFTNTQLQVQAAGVSLGLGGLPLPSATQSTLSAAAPELDQAINGLTNILGVQLGVADVSVNGLRCHDGVLVQ
jgi:uncharacterized membrane protein